MEDTVDAVRIERHDQSEWRVDNRHHHLELDTGARSEAGIRSRQESHLFCHDLAVAVQDPARQLALPCDPRISNIEVRSHREYTTHKRNAVFNVHYALRISSDPNDIVIRAGYRVSGFRIGHSNLSNDVRDGCDLTEVKAANIEITAHEEPLIVRNRRVVES